MASLIDFSFRDLRDKFLADLSKAECEVREHLVNATAVIQVRTAVPVSASAVPASANADEIAALETKITAQEKEYTSEIMYLQNENKKLRKENVELQVRLKDTAAVDKLEADLEAAHRQNRTLAQENLVLRNSMDMNDKYAAQDKKLYAELEAKYKALQEKYTQLEQSIGEKQKEIAPVKTEEPKKEVKKVEKRQPEPEPEEEEVEEEAEEEEAADEEEGEEPVEFEYKGKTYYLSSDNDVYQMENDEFVQVGTWNGKKILFQ